jgi:type IV secretion system protein VirD4
MVVDEFPILGRLELLARSLSLIAGYGIRACLAAQDLTQIYEAYGHNESITSGCDTKVALTPNNIQTAEELSKLLGPASVRHEHRTRAGGGASVSEPEVGRPLMTPDEVRRLGVDETLIFARGQRPIRAALLRFYEQPYFKRLATIMPPAASDRTITAPRAESAREETAVQPTAVTTVAAVNGVGNGAVNGGAPKAQPTVKDTGGSATEPPVEFLGFAAGAKLQAGQRQ